MDCNPFLLHQPSNSCNRRIISNLKRNTKKHFHGGCLLYWTKIIELLLHSTTIHWLFFSFSLNPLCMDSFTSSSQLSVWLEQKMIPKIRPWLHIKEKMRPGYYLIECGFFSLIFLVPCTEFKFLFELSMHEF